MKLNKLVLNPIYYPKAILAFAMLMYMGAANAQMISLPGSQIFCELAIALKSQMAPGIFMMILIVEGIMYYFMPKNAMMKILLFIITAGVVFGGSTYLGYVGVPQSCGV